MRGEDRHGRPNRYLKNIMALGGRAARQHLILLLAGRHLSDDLFDILCREVENLFFVYVVTREATRDFERNFASWANELKTIDDERALQAFVERRFTGSKGELSVRFDEAMRRLSGGMIQQYRLRYIVAKLTQYVDLQGFGEIDGTVWLARYLGGGNDIEHILPQIQPPKRLRSSAMATCRNSRDGLATSCWQRTRSIGRSGIVLIQASARYTRDPSSF